MRTPKEFLQPTDSNVKVWRYLDLAKFIWMLRFRKLYFPRVDLLSDPHEGALSPKNRETLKKFYSDSGYYSRRQLESFSARRRRQRSEVYASCWRMGNSESEAMWRLYCGFRDGVAIQTTYAKLRDSITYPEVYIGLVKYVDYNANRIPYNTFLRPFMHKREAFSHEHEVRAITIHTKKGSAGKNQSPLGVSIKLNIARAVDQVWVSPFAPEWFHEVVVAVVKELQPDLGSKISWSNMRSEPFF